METKNNTTTILFSFDEALLPVIKLQCQRLKCIYEQGHLRYIKFDNTEIIRCIYFAVRNEKWQTVPYTIENEIIEKKENGFFITYTSYCQLNDILYKADISILMEGHSILFTVNGEAQSDFNANRIGICTLHPVKECRGKEVLVKQPDDSFYKSVFPDLIAPHQPFKNIGEMRYAPEANLAVALQFDGDVFETEDQRNWTDNSYKTYSTPLELPYPVRIIRGAKIEQKVQLSINQDEGNSIKSKNSYKEIKTPFPNIGYCRMEHSTLTTQEIPLLKQIPFNHYRVEVIFEQADWKNVLALAYYEALQLETKLDLVLFFDENFKSQLAECLPLLEKYALLIRTILLLHLNHPTIPEQVFNYVYEQIKKKFSYFKIGYGTNGFFADLNRNPPGNFTYDFVSFSLNPQVHASDTRTIMENLECQNDLIDTIASFAPEKEIHIAPITFKIRYSSNSLATKIQPDFDARQHSSFGALWTLAAIRNLSMASSLTFYHAKSHRGILNDKNTNSLTPLYHALKMIEAFQPEWIIDDNHSIGSYFLPVLLENKQGHKLEFIIEDGDLFSQEFQP